MHNTNIRLIIVEQRVIIDLCFSLLLFEQRCMMVYQIYYYMSAIRVYYVFVGYIFSLFICGQIICNIFELRLFLYLTVSKWLLLVPRFWMNIAIYGVLIVERLINIFGI